MQAEQLELGADGLRDPLGSKGAAWARLTPLSTEATVPVGDTGLPASHLLQSSGVYPSIYKDSASGLEGPGLLFPFWHHHRHCRKKLLLCDVNNEPRGAAFYGIRLLDLLRPGHKAVPAAQAEELLASSALLLTCQ